MFARACFGCFPSAQSQAPISTKSLEDPLPFNRPFNAMIMDVEIFIELPSAAVLHKVSSGPQQMPDDGLKKADHVPASPTACQQDDAMPDTGAATGEFASEPAVIVIETVISPALTVDIIRGGQKAEAADGVIMPAALAAKAVETAGDKTAPTTPFSEATAPPSALLGGRFIGGSRSSGDGGDSMTTRLGSIGSLARTQSTRISGGPANPYRYLVDELNRQMTPRSSRRKSSGDPIADLAGMVQAVTRGRPLSVAVAETRAASERLSRGIPVLPPSRGALRSGSSKCVGDLPSLAAGPQQARLLAEWMVSHFSLLAAQQKSSSDANQG